MLAFHNEYYVLTLIRKTDFSCSVRATDNETMMGTYKVYPARYLGFFSNKRSPNEDRWLRKRAIFHNLNRFILIEQHLKRCLKKQTHIRSPQNVDNMEFYSCDMRLFRTHIPRNREIQKVLKIILAGHCFWLLLFH